MASTPGSCQCTRQTTSAPGKSAQAAPQRRPYEFSLEELRTLVGRHSPALPGSGRRWTSGVAGNRCTASCGDSSVSCEGDSCIASDGTGCDAWTAGVHTSKRCITSSEPGGSAAPRGSVPASRRFVARVPPRPPGPWFVSPPDIEEAECTTSCGSSCFAGAGQGCASEGDTCATFRSNPTTGATEVVYSITCPPPMS